MQRARQSAVVGYDEKGFVEFMRSERVCPRLISDNSISQFLSLQAANLVRSVCAAWFSCDETLTVSERGIVRTLRLEDWTTMQ